MSSPMFYILAPVGLAFVLFAVFLVVSIFLKDPARPFRMFKAPPLDKGAASPESSVHPSTSSGQGSPEEEKQEEDENSKIKIQDSKGE